MSRPTETLSMPQMVEKYGMWACLAGFYSWSRINLRLYMASEEATKNAVNMLLRREHQGPRVASLCAAIAHRARSRNPPR